MPVEGALSGSAAAAVWADLHARMRSFVSRRIADPHAADDLAQDILVRIHERMGGLRDEERLDAWAYQVARRAIIDHYRAQAARRETPVGHEPDQADPATGADPGALEPSAEEARRQMAVCLAPMVDRLPEPYREAILLTDLGELTQAAAAERLQLSVPAMKARVQRARAKLRAMLLACCRVAVDGRGSPVEAEPRSPGMTQTKSGVADPVRGVRASLDPRQ